MFLLVYRLAKGRQAMHKPLPQFNSETAYFEVSRTPSRKYIVTLVDGAKRSPVRQYNFLFRCILFAHWNNLPLILVGSAAWIYLILEFQLDKWLNQNIRFWLS